MNCTVYKVQVLTPLLDQVVSMTVYESRKLPLDEMIVSLKAEYPNRFVSCEPMDLPAGSSP